MGFVLSLFRLVILRGVWIMRRSTFVRPKSAFGWIVGLSVFTIVWSCAWLVVFAVLGGVGNE